MRLAFDLSIARQPLGGTLRYATELLRSMRAGTPAGWELSVLAGLPRARRDGRMPGAGRRAVNLASDLAWWAVGAPAADLHHALDAWYAPANGVPLRTRLPTIVTIHDLNVFEVPGLYDAAFGRWARARIRHAARSADGIVTPSRYVRDRVIGELGVPLGSVRAIASGSDHLERDTPLTDGGLPRPFALYVGQTEPHKNVGLLLEAWRAGVPDGLHLVICGPPGRADGDLRTMAGQADLRGRVHFPGPLVAGRLRAAYRDATMLLFPSMAEGFGFPPLEAMREGVPTAVADRAALPEVTAGGAMTFDPEDAAGLAALVTRMAEDVSLRTRLRAIGQEVAARYTWASTARETWSVVASLTTASTSSRTRREGARDRDR